MRDMIQTEYRCLDSNMNPVPKEKADMVEILQKDESGSILDSELIIISS